MHSRSSHSISTGLVGPGLAGIEGLARRLQTPRRHGTAWAKSGAYQKCGSPRVGNYCRPNPDKGQCEWRGAGKQRSGEAFFCRKARIDGSPLGIARRVHFLGGEFFQRTPNAAVHGRRCVYRDPTETLVCDSRRPNRGRGGRLKYASFPLLP